MAWRRSTAGAVALLLSLCASSLLLWPVGPRRLLSLSVAWTNIDVDFTIDSRPDDFTRWMSNAGLEVPDTSTSGHMLSHLKERLILRILAFAVDVLPDSVVKDYSEHLAEVEGIDLSAKRELTYSEQLIRDELARQAEHSEELLKSSTGYNTFAFMPKFVGRVLPGKTMSWSSRCWKEVTATVEKKDGQWTLEVKVAKSTEWLCEEMFGLFTASHFHVGSFPAPIGGTKSFTFKSDTLTDAQTWDVDTLGMRIFMFHESSLATVRNLLETALLFVPEKTKGVPSLIAQRNLKFLRDYVGIDMKKRRDPGTLLLNESEIASGDFFGVIRLDGLDPMLAFGMGSHTGHTTVALWEDGQLYVAESTTNSSYWPTNGIQRTPYRQWIDQARAAGLSVVHVPLKEEYRKMFDERAANAFFHKYQGLEYGYHTLVTGWIDTLHDNYPCIPPYDATDKQCLSWELLEVAMPIVTRYIPRLEKPFLLSWNQHVTGSSYSNLSGTALYKEAMSKGMALASIPAVPEQDGVLYPSVFNNGTRAPSIAMVCDVFVCNVWKAAGIFKEIENDFSCTEQTNIDIYGLNVLEAPKKRAAACIAADPNNTLCQLTGDYEMHLPKVGQRSMYRHMQEKCPTQPPLYERPDTC
ncbi:unnamed protein product [Effrenium voratum]|uniref:Uncharacterized protein n=2 Tax=Effrenium voratum TaxID=2562239 RepID=A0AA36JKG5_9DINO|nr:unnamed protein product [Effrenium voratum]CAJ1406648.1 unnamed protein product [Effrenium voratum]CAJ1425601.1 unnamed protein product [Effrenium voratum]